MLARPLSGDWSALPGETHGSVWCVSESLYLLLVLQEPRLGLWRLIPVEGATRRRCPSPRAEVPAPSEATDANAAPPPCMHVY